MSLSIQLYEKREDKFLNQLVTCKKRSKIFSVGLKQKQIQESFTETYLFRRMPYLSVIDYRFMMTWHETLSQEEYILDTILYLKRPGMAVVTHQLGVLCLVLTLSMGGKCSFLNVDVTRTMFCVCSSPSPPPPLMEAISDDKNPRQRKL